MAQSKKVLEVIAVAVAMLEVAENAELSASVAKLEAIEDANGNTQEYKDLKVFVEQLQAEKAKIEDDAKKEKDAQKVIDDKKAQDELDAQKTSKKVEKTEKPNYAGVRMVGSKWYCKKDNYKQGFSTADECAEHFNE